MGNSELLLEIIAGGLAALAGLGGLLYARKRKAAPPLDQEQSAVAPTVPVEVTSPTVTAPEIAATRLQRLRQRLAGSGNLGRSLLTLLSRDRLDTQTWTEIEDTLIMADLGVATANELVANLKLRLQVEKAEDVKTVLREELLKVVNPDLDRSLNLGKNPAVFLVVGVNGTGKTTTVGKLARLLVAENKSVLLGAADTFRAAAAEQLATWGERIGVNIVQAPEGSDPASVAFDAVHDGIESGIEVILIDTAGRLQNKAGLMDELGKIKRVIEKQAELAEVLLVLDATTGQNGMLQAKAFAEAVQITGIVLTKLDGSAKGGIVVSVQKELGVPVKLVGLGEGVDDLAPFDPEEFVAAILE